MSGSRGPSAHEYETRLECVDPSLSATTRVRRTPWVEEERRHLRLLLVRAGSIVFDETGHANVGDVIVVAPGGRCRLEPEELTAVTIVAVDADLLFDLVRWRFGRTLAARSDASDFLSGRYPSLVWRVRLPQDWIRSTSPWIDELAALTDEHAFIDRFYRLIADLSMLLDALLPHLAPTSSSTLPDGHVSPAVPGGTASARGVICRVEARHIDALFHRDLRRDWTLRQLAEIVCLSPSQVRRVMVASYGRTPLAHLNRLRAEEAARIIRSQDVTLMAAFRRVGWSNRGYAARVFTQVVGITPQQYAAHHRQRV